MKIESYKEWSRNPSWHGDYSDYVSHMENEKRIQKRESEERIAKLVAKELGNLLNK